MARWYLQRPGGASVGPIDPGELQAAWGRQEIPPGTMVCAEGFSQWVPFHTVAELVGASAAVAPSIARPEPIPSRVRGLVAMLAIVPLVYAVLHVVLFGTRGVMGPSSAVLLGLVIAIVITRTSLRSRTAPELFRMRALSIPVGALFLLCEGVGLGFGVGGRVKEGRIRAAIEATDPCAVETVLGDAKEYGTEEEQQKLESRLGACGTAREEASCVRALAALDRKSTNDSDYVVDGEAHQSVRTHDVFARLAQSKLAVDDLADAKSDLACGDRLWSRLIAALAATTSAWTTVGPGTALPAADKVYTLSPDIEASLTAVTIGEPVKGLLRARAEIAAKGVFNKSKSADMQDAKAECDQAATLRVDSGPSCAALEKQYAALDAKELAADRRMEATANRQVVGEDPKKEAALFVSCMTSCNRSRSAAEAQDDNARAAGCSEKCGDDTTCLASCDTGSASACQLGCAQKYPGAALGQ